MKVEYLEIVTPDVDAFCDTYATAYGVTFGDPVAELVHEQPVGTFAILMQGGVQQGLWQA